MKKRRGFTLVETLVVALLFGLLVSIIAAYLVSSRGAAKDSRISIKVSQIDSIAEMIYSDKGEYDSMCVDEILSSERGLDEIMEDIIKNGGVVACFAEGNNYCVSTRLNSGKYFCIKNNRMPGLSDTGCISPTEGCDDEIGEEIDNGYIPIPQCLKSEGTAIQISAGDNHIIALNNNGEVLAWGDNSFGQLGDGTYDNRNIPVQVRGSHGTNHLNDIIAISSGAWHSLALNNNGEVFAWGGNIRGQLGSGNFTTRENIPIQVKGPGGVGHLNKVIAISAGERHSLALREDNTLWAWGHNNFGQLGEGGIATQRSIPIQVKNEAGTGNLTGIISIASGGNQSFAIDTNNVAWAWGSNPCNGSDESKNLPVSLSPQGMTDITDLSAGKEHVLFLKENNTLYSCGNNSSGQLGDGTTNNRNIPVQVKGPGGTGYLENVIIISATPNTSFAIKENRLIYVWGDNSSGQFGDGTKNSSLFPKQVNIQK